MQTSASANSPLEHGGAGTCRYCSSTGLRRSKLRSDDYLGLLFLMWPLRCMECRKRQMAFLPRAMRAISAKSAHNGDFRSVESWQGYTAKEAPQSPAKHEEVH